jgi:hypothetical protein
VGPSIASGNQTCKPICADLPIEPKKRKKQIKFKQSIFMPIKDKVIFFKKGAKTNTIEKSTVRK